MELNIGQKVAYPSQGVCSVESIEKKLIGDSTIICYGLRVLSDNSIILVPKSNANTVGIRPLISTGQCKKLIDSLSSDFEATTSDWKARSRLFAEKLQSCDIFQVADVLKKLTLISMEKKLSFREQTLLEKAKFLVVSEVASCRKCTEESLKKKVDDLVKLACERHIKARPEPVASH